ncbi:MAG: hypothetical protein IK093_01600 [Ruminiclostridium sp.]|nr:hypothetical protein [Ruminiclostridium sp.]
MSYDLKVLSVGASCKLNISCGSITAVRTDGFGSAFAQDYPFAAKMRGEWFELRRDTTPDILGSFDICDFEFEHGNRELFWRQSSNDHYSLVFRSPELFEDMKRIMKQLRKLSPTGMLVFLPRLQGEERNDICGVITLDEFIALIPEKRVYSNVCYIIQD